MLWKINVNILYRKERGVFYWVDFKLLIYIIKWVEENNSVIV